MTYERVAKVSNSVGMWLGKLLLFVGTSEFRMPTEEACAKSNAGCMGRLKCGNYSRRSGGDCESGKMGQCEEHGD
jgi:hypothetical protein